MANRFQPARADTGETVDERVLEAELVHAFAPMHKLAFGVAIGSVCALGLFTLTALRLVLDPQGRTDLSLLAQFLAGYEESWAGALIGAAWGFFIGFVAGWFLAFVRNLVLAIWLLVVLARADMQATRDFLDHI